MPAGRGTVSLRLLAGLGLTFLLLPLAGLLSRTPWSSLGSGLSSDVVASAVRLSLVVSLSSTVVAVVLGVPLAYLLARSDGMLGEVVRVVCILPMLMPPVVAGVGLLAAFGRTGLLGEPLDRAVGVTIPFSTPAAVIACTFVSIPFVVISCEAGFRSLDQRLTEIAGTLGASPSAAIRDIVFPLMKPSLFAGIALQWARSVGEYGATITFAGNLRGVTQTSPLAIVMELERDYGTAVMLSLCMTVSSALCLLLVRRLATVRAAGRARARTTTIGREAELLGAAR